MKSETTPHRAAPRPVRRKRYRYWQVVVPNPAVHVCGRVQPPVWRPIWHLDGVPWYRADTPRGWHIHRAQTVARFLREVWRCRCGAYGGPGQRWQPMAKTTKGVRS